MSNVFTATPGTSEPREIIQGDYTTWKKTEYSDDYPNTSYTLSYKARLEGDGTTVITLTATNSGDDYLIVADADTTAAYTVGVYHWQLYITDSGDSSKRVTLDYGTFEIKPNKAAATTDPRTHAKIMLDKIESLLEGRADADVSTYSIQGRSLTKLSIDDLLKWRSFYRAEVKKEEQAERVRNGNGSGRLIKASFNVQGSNV